MSGNHAGALIYLVLPLIVTAASLVARQLAFRAERPMVPLWLSCLFITIWSVAVVGLIVKGSEGQSLFPHSKDYWLVGFVFTAISGMVLVTALFQPIRR